LRGYYPKIWKWRSFRGIYFEDSGSRGRDVLGGGKSSHLLGFVLFWQGELSFLNDSMESTFVPLLYKLKACQRLNFEQGCIGLGATINI